MTTRKGKIINQGYTFKGSLALPPIDRDASFHVELSKEQILAKGDIKQAIVFPKKGTRLFALYRQDHENLGPYLELVIKESTFTCIVSAAVSFLGLSFATSLELSSRGLKIHNTVSVNLPVVKSAVDVYGVVDKTHFLVKSSCDFQISIPLDIFGLSEVKVVKFAAAFGASVDWSKLSFDFWVTGSVEALELARIDVGTITIRGDVPDLPELAKELGKKIAGLLPDFVGRKYKKGLNEALKFLKDLGLAAVKAGEYIVNKFKERVRAVVIQLQAVYNLAKDAIVDIARALAASYDDTVAIAKALGYAVVDFLV